MFFVRAKPNGLHIVVVLMDNEPVDEVHEAQNEEQKYTSELRRTTQVGPPEAGTPRPKRHPCDGSA